MATVAISTHVKPQANLDQIKFDICCAARILYRQGMSVANAGHISVAIAPDRMLMNRFGPSFATLHPNDILTLDFRGNIRRGPHRAEERARQRDGRAARGDSPLQSAGRLRAAYTSSGDCDF